MSAALSTAVAASSSTPADVASDELHSSRCNGSAATATSRWRRVRAFLKKRKRLSPGACDASDLEPKIVPSAESDAVLAAALGKQIEPEQVNDVAKQFAAILRQRLAAAKAAKAGALRRKSQLGLPPEAIVRAASESGLAVSPPRRLTRRSSRLEVMDGTALLEQRLTFAGLRQEEMLGDGNCQFRALSYELYDTQEEHAFVRRKVCAHMRERREEFAIYFEEGEFDLFLERMATDRTWGDELTLRAAADAFGCTIHVITSTKENWHLVYVPEGTTPPVKLLFLTYVSPVHYNAIDRVPIGKPMRSSPARGATRAEPPPLSKSVSL